MSKKKLCITIAIVIAVCFIFGIGIFACFKINNTPKKQLSGKLNTEGDLSNSKIIIKALQHGYKSAEILDINKEQYAADNSEQESIKCENILENKSEIKSENTSEIKSENTSEIDEKEQSRRNLYNAYYDKIIDLQNKYGTINKISNNDYLAFDYFTGVFFAKLIDFDNDGQEELVVAYLETDGTDMEDIYSVFRNYKMEVYSFQNMECKKIYECSPYIPHEAEEDFMFYIGQYENCYYIIQGNDGMEYTFWKYDGQEFRWVKKFIYDWISNDMEYADCMIDGIVVSNEKFNIEFGSWMQNCQSYMAVDFTDNEDDISYGAYNDSTRNMDKNFIELENAIKVLEKYRL